MKTSRISTITQAARFSIVILMLAYGPPLRAQESKAAQTVTLAQLSRLIGGPTLITLHFKNAPPEAVFAEVARQAKVKILTPALDDQNKPVAPISIDVVRQPFWRVMRSLCSQIKADADVNTDIYDTRPVTITFNGSESIRGPVSDQSLALTVAESISQSSELDYYQPDYIDQTWSLNLILVVDPKLRLLNVLPPFKLKKVVDEAGRTIFDPVTAANQGSGDPFGLLTSLYFNSSGPLVKRGHLVASNRMRDFNGTARLFVGFNIQRWEVPDILSAKNAVRVVQRTTGPSRYTVQNVVTTDTDYEVHLTISEREFDLEDQFASTAEFEGRIHLFDGQGHEFPLDQAHVHTSSGFDDPVSLIVPFERKSEDGDALFHIAKLGAPQKLVIEIPDVRAVEVPVEFRNLPLP